MKFLQKKWVDYLHPKTERAKGSLFLKESECLKYSTKSWCWNNHREVQNLLRFSCHCSYHWTAVRNNLEKQCSLYFASDIFLRFPLVLFCCVGWGLHTWPWCWDTWDICLWGSFSINSSIQYSLDAVVTGGCTLGCAHVLVCRLPGWHALVIVFTDTWIWDIGEPHTLFQIMGFQVVEAPELYLVGVGWYQGANSWPHTHQANSLSLHYLSSFSSSCLFHLILGFVLCVSCLVSEEPCLLQEEEWYCT